jgi:hypothetical protein
MDDLIASIPVIAVTVIIVIAIFWFTNRNKKQKEIKIRQLAELHNWTFEPVQEELTWGYRLKGPQWSLESYSRSEGPSNDSGSSNIFKTTLWKTEAVSLPGHRVVIGPRLSQNSLAGMGSLFVNKAFQILAGDQAAGLEEVSFENSPLNRRYIVLAQHPTDAQHLLTPLKEHILMAWHSQPPVIKYSPQGLEIGLQGASRRTAGDS